MGSNNLTIEEFKNTFKDEFKDSPFKEEFTLVFDTVTSETRLFRGDFEELFRNPNLNSSDSPKDRNIHIRSEIKIFLSSVYTLIEPGESAKVYLVYKLWDNIGYYIERFIKNNTFERVDILFKMLNYLGGAITDGDNTIWHAARAYVEYFDTFKDRKVGVSSLVTESMIQIIDGFFLSMNDHPAANAIKSYFISDINIIYNLRGEGERYDKH